MVKLATSVIDFKINSLLLSLNLKLNGIKEANKPAVVTATTTENQTLLKSVPAASKLEASAIKLKPSSSIETAIRDDIGEPNISKPTPLKRGISSTSEVSNSAKKPKLNGADVYLEQPPLPPLPPMPRDRSENHQTRDNSSSTPRGKLNHKFDKYFR